MRTLYVTKTSLNELHYHGWKISAMRESFPYIRCNKKGKVDWEKSSIYTPEELIERNNVKIIKRK